MFWLTLFVAYGATVEKVIDTSHLWGPAALGVAALAWNVRQIPRRRRRRTDGPDTSEDTPDTPSDIHLPAAPPAS
ncbi:hypothetical protein ACFY0G_17330 [Streptomyces sp. NPDC001552]|uniref:hypothetical protein n=1 Tax=Streptomyces sp. NPDC001552 TaxID=3364587 RepID=UPI00367F01AD